MSVHSLTSEAGIGFRSHDLVKDFTILMSRSETGLKEDRVLLLLLGLVAETGADD